MLKPLVLSLAVLVLIGCSDNSENLAITQKAHQIEANDECHLCGMLIEHFDGPKGQAYRKEIDEQSSNRVKKFCSTRDLMSYYLDPENTRNITTIYVHDMSKMPWQHIDDNFFINAKEAWFVVGSNRMGAMGKTLASFSKKTDASEFAKEYGGKVLAFNELSYNDI